MLPYAGRKNNRPVGKKKKEKEKKKDQEKKERKGKEVRIGDQSSEKENQLKRLEEKVVEGEKPNTKE